MGELTWCVLSHHIGAERKHIKWQRSSETSELERREIIVWHGMVSSVNVMMWASGDSLVNLFVSVGEASEVGYRDLGRISMRSAMEVKI